MSEDQFTKLYKYFERSQAETRAEFQKVHTRIDGVYGLLDTVIKQNETLHQEQQVMKHQLTRHEKWLHILADNTHTVLKYD